MALSGDDQRLASGGFDGTIRLWAAPGGTPLAVLEGHAGLVQAVALSADGRLVASGSLDGTVRLWSAPEGRSLRTLRADRRCERLDITGVRGLTAAQRAALVALGAVENEPTSAHGTVDGLSRRAAPLPM